MVRGRLTTSSQPGPISRSLMYRISPQPGRRGLPGTVADGEASAHDANPDRLDLDAGRGPLPEPCLRRDRDGRRPGRPRRDLLRRRRHDRLYPRDGGAVPPRPGCSRHPAPLVGPLPIVGSERDRRGGSRSVCRRHRAVGPGRQASRATALRVAGRRGPNGHRRLQHMRGTGLRPGAGGPWRQALRQLQAGREFEDLWGFQHEPEALATSLLDMGFRA